MVGYNFGQLLLDVLGIARLSTDSCEHLNGAIDFALLDEVTGRFGEEQKTGSKDKSPKHLKANGDAIRAGISPVLCAIVDARGKQKTDGDAKLVTGHDRASNLPRSNLGHVQDDDGRNETNTKTGNQTTGNEQSQAGRGGLENDTDDENNASEDDGGPTPDPISKITTEKSTEESSGRENGHDERFLPGGENEVGGKGFGWVRHAGDGVDEIVHAHHSADITRVISEEDTTKGRKSAHEVSFDRHGRLDAIDIARGGER